MERRIEELDKNKNYLINYKNEKIAIKYDTDLKIWKSFSKIENTNVSNYKDITINETVVNYIEELGGWKE